MGVVRGGVFSGGEVSGSESVGGWVGSVMSSPQAARGRSSRTQSKQIRRFMAVPPKTRPPEADKHGSIIPIVSEFVNGELKSCVKTTKDVAKRFGKCGNNSGIEIKFFKFL